MRFLEPKDLKTKNELQRVDPSCNSSLVQARFILGSGRELRERVQQFPSPWREYFLSSKILVTGVVEDQVVSAYGIRSMLNVMAVYVKEEYRGKGIGGLTSERAVDILRQQGTHFITAEVPVDNKASLYLSFKTGSKLIKNLKARKTVLVLWPLTSVGNLVYICSRIVCSLLPDKTLAQIIDSVSKETAHLRQRNWKKLRE